MEKTDVAKKPTTSATKITRITAGNSNASIPKRTVSVQDKVKKSVKSATDIQTNKRAMRIKNPASPLWRYIKGSWYELRQVRWPDRRATWGMTGALILFTLLFVVIILLLDAGFSELFKLILGK